MKTPCGKSGFRLKVERLELVEHQQEQDRARLLATPALESEATALKG